MISIGANLFILGKYLMVDQWYDPSEDENIILSELVKKSIDSDDYKLLSEKENIVAIDSSIDKNKGGVYPYYFEVSVSTDKQTYLFSCKDDICSDVEMGGTTYSIYEDENPRLPLKE